MVTRAVERLAEDENPLLSDGFIASKTARALAERYAGRKWAATTALWLLFVLPVLGCSSTPSDGSERRAAPPCTVCDGVCVDTQTDRANCGACGLVCSSNAPSTAECTAGRCLVTLAVGQPTLSSIVVDDHVAYWTEFSSDGAVMKVPLAGGSPATFATGQPYSLNAIVDAKNAYWVTYDDRADFAVMKAALDGGEPTTLASGQRVPRPDAIAVDSQSLYWLAGASLFDGPGLVVMKVPLEGGTPAVLASPAFDSGGGIALDANSVYFDTGGTAANHYTDGLLLKVPLDGGPVTTLASDQVSPREIVVSGGWVYWTTNQGVSRIPVDGGTPVTLAAGNFPSGLIVGATDLYWIEGGSVLKWSLDGGAKVTLASQQLTLRGLTMDETSLYWINDGAISGILDDRVEYDDGTVMKLTPK